MIIDQCFIYGMQLPSWNCVLHKQTQIVANAACKVGSKQFLSYQRNSSTGIHLNMYRYTSKCNVGKLFL